MAWRYIAPVAGLVGLALAQTSTSCNPLNTTDCPTDPAFGTEYFWKFNTTPSSDLWETSNGYVSYDSEKGATFTINEQGDAPTIRSKFYIFFGRYEMMIKSSPGQGICSSTMCLSDDLDEIDWEILGYNGTQVATNYYGKGRTDDTSGGYNKTSVNVTEGYYNYTVDWTKERIEWWFDGVLYRTLRAEDANNTKNYPQTPCRLSLGIWAGGDPDNSLGTIEWAGGETNYTNGPYNMYVESVKMIDYTSGSTNYTYGNESGTWESIEIGMGNSSAYTAIHTKAKVEETVAEKWDNLSTTAKVAIYAGGGAAAAVGIAALAFFYIRARRAGAAEAKAADEKTITERHELMGYKGIEDAANESGGSEFRSGGWTKL